MIFEKQDSFDCEMLVLFKNFDKDCSNNYGRLKCKRMKLGILAVLNDTNGVSTSNTGLTL